MDPNSSDGEQFPSAAGLRQPGPGHQQRYANYNALQTTWVRTKGRYTINMNYTFGKAMGIINPTLDPYNLNNDYGVQPTNRTHIFNAAYSIELGNPYKGNKLLAGAVNGWQLSGITQLESGANLTGFSSGNNFGTNLNNYLIPGSNANGAAACYDQQRFASGNAGYSAQSDSDLQPDSGLGANQFINPNCFGIPTEIGQNGPSVLPAIYGPAFFNSDLGLFKNFQIKESMKLQFRVQRVQLPEPPAVVVQRKQPEPGFRRYPVERHLRKGQHADVRYCDPEAGTAHHPTRGEVQLLTFRSRNAALCLFHHGPSSEGPFL